MFSSRDDEWKRLRSIASPTFTSGKMKKMYPLIKECSKDCMENLESHAIEGKDANMKDIHGNFTMDVIAKCAFATNTNAHKDPNNPFVANAKEIFNFKLWRIMSIVILPAFMLKLISIKSFASEKANQFFFNVTRHILGKRRANNEKHNDFLQLLMDASATTENTREDTDANEAHHVNEGEEELDAQRKALTVNFKKHKLDDDEILAQAWLFFIAGYETTATTLTFCSYELALNQECQQKLYDEIISVADANGDIEYETLSKLPYLDSVLCETLRMYPPVLRLEREVTVDYQLGDINLYKGQVVEIPVYAIHHCEEYYPSPEQFYPDRFLPENRHLIKPYTYMPFGAGPRNCIGMRFALLEAKLSLSKIVQKYKFVRTPNTDVPLKINPGRRLIGAKRVIVGVKKR